MIDEHQALSRHLARALNRAQSLEDRSANPRARLSPGERAQMAERADGLYSVVKRGERRMIRRRARTHAGVITKLKWFLNGLTGKAPGGDDHRLIESAIADLAAMTRKRR